MILPITLTIAGAAALLHIWLSMRVSRLRRPLKIAVGDGGNETLARRMRAHGNYSENMPIFLILLALLELAGGDRNLLWAAAILFVLARIAHALGMDRPGANPLRVGGIGINWLVLLGLAGWALSHVYLDPRTSGEPIRISPGRSAQIPADPAG